MNRRRAAFLASAFASWTLLFAMVGCRGGVSQHAPDDGGIGVGQCTPLACPPEAAWDPVSCACQPIASSTSPGNPGCSAGCPSGTVLEIVNGGCGCVAFPEGGVEPLDATLDVTEIDAPVVTYYDASADSDADLTDLIPYSSVRALAASRPPPRMHLRPRLPQFVSVGADLRRALQRLLRVHLEVPSRVRVRRGVQLRPGRHHAVRPGPRRPVLRLHGKLPVRSGPLVSHGHLP